MTSRSSQFRFEIPLKGIAAAAFVLASPLTWAADTDIYGAPGAGGAVPNVVFLLDNTSNWATAKQDWNKASVDAKCNALPVAAQKTICLNYSSQIFNGASKLEQGRVELRALKLVLNELVCSGTASALKVNIGLSLMAKQSRVNNGHGVGIINHAVQPLAGTATTAGSSCKALIDKLDAIDAKVTDPTWQSPASANYGAALYEIFKYFGGHTNPTLAPNPAPNGGLPVGYTGYGPDRYSDKNTLDDPAAFTDAGKLTYKSPLSAANSCGNNYVVLVGNAYPNSEPASNGGPTVFNGINYTPPTLPIGQDPSRYADEWTYFLANTDVSGEPGVQRILTYTVNTYNDKEDTDQSRLLKSMAAQGGIGPAGYLEVGGDLFALVDGFRDILVNIASVNSVFTATTLPVSTTAQGTFLNQIFVGMFRPDGNAGPRWVGNLKQYQLSVIGGVLDLAGQDVTKSVVTGGFFSGTAVSLWTEDSVFFDQKKSGTPLSASDKPDGPIVEKGGVAQQLRKKYEQGASTRKVLTMSAGSLADFTAASSGLTTAQVSWIRGENNVTTGLGMEEFNGSFISSPGGTTALLGTTGARHSIHGDVLHSRPIALNYGAGDVAVYYGTNDGFLRAVDGNKTGPTAGQELWSFIAPEHYGMQTRLRDGTPTVHLPETNSTGGTIAAPTGSAPKSYGMDGPIGLYARYKSAAAGGAISEAIIYATMRRGGRSVYAFDVTSKTTPTFKWKIAGGTGSYVKLAQTWSMPKAVVFSATSTTSAPVVIMGGGYDPLEDTNSSSGTGDYSGKAIYIVNGADGTLIKELSTEFSVPSDVTVVDVDGNGEPDRAYVADVRGGLYRVDFPTTGDRTLPTTWSAVTAVKIASLGGKVFFAPDVVVTKDFVAVLVGTGDREKPLLNTTADKFALIRDTLGATPRPLVSTLDLAEVASVNSTTMALIAPGTPATATALANGCYINLATNGEKAINAPFTIAGATYFGTNRPKPASSTSCTADLGEAYAYKFPLFCSVPAKPIQVLGGGMLPSPVGGIVTVNVNGVETKMPFLIGGGMGGSAFKPDEPKPPVPPVRTRQNWRIDNSNR